MLAELVGLVADGTISRNQAKDVLDESLREDKWPRDIVEARGLAQVSDEGALAAVVDEVLAANADASTSTAPATTRAEEEAAASSFGQIKGSSRARATRRCSPSSSTTASNRGCPRQLDAVLIRCDHVDVTNGGWVGVVALRPRDGVERSAVSNEMRCTMSP